MRYVALLAAFALLSGCVGIGEVREVRIPIPTPCVSAIPSRPESALDKLPPNATVYDAVQSLLVDRERIGNHVTTLEALLEACKSL